MLEPAAVFQGSTNYINYVGAGFSRMITAPAAHRPSTRSSRSELLSKVCLCEGILDCGRPTCGGAGTTPTPTDAQLFDPSDHSSDDGDFDEQALCAAPEASTCRVHHGNGRRATRNQRICFVHGNAHGGLYHKHPARSSAELGQSASGRDSGNESGAACSDSESAVTHSASTTQAAVVGPSRHGRKSAMQKRPFRPLMYTPIDLDEDDSSSDDWCTDEASSSFDDQAWTCGICGTENDGVEKVFRTDACTACYNSRPVRPPSGDWGHPRSFNRRRTSVTNVAQRWNLREADAAEIMMNVQLANKDTPGF